MLSTDTIISILKVTTLQVLRVGGMYSFLASSYPASLQVY